MKKLYAEQWRLFKELHWKLFVAMFILFFGSTIAVYLFLINNEILVTSLMEQVMKMFEEKDMLGPDTTSSELAFGLFKNNFIACLVIFLTGFIPIFIPAVFIIVVNGGIMGVLFAYVQLAGESVINLFLTGIVPHGVFEIPAIVFSGALAFYLSVSIYKKLGNPEFSLKQAIIQSFKAFALVCIPLLIMAAVVEAFVTPMLLGV